MSLIEAILSRVAPHNCLVCGEEGELVCVWCRIETFPHLPSRCYNCYAATENSAVCQKCRRLSPLKHVWVRTEYEAVAKQLIHSYKFKQARDGAKIIAEFIKESLPYLSDILVVPVPTATQRVRQRGFDHAGLIAKNLSSLTGLEFSPALKRMGQTKQVGTKRTERKSQLKGAFRATNDLTDKHILLIDDVITTGASIEETARICRQAGAKTVDAAIFAQRQ